MYSGTERLSREDLLVLARCLGGCVDECDWERERVLRLVEVLLAETMPPGALEAANDNEVQP